MFCVQNSPPLAGWNITFRLSIVCPFKYSFRKCIIRGIYVIKQFQQRNSPFLICSKHHRLCTMVIRIYIWYNKNFIEVLSPICCSLITSQCVRLVCFVLVMIGLFPDVALCSTSMECDGVLVADVPCSSSRIKTRQAGDRWQCIVKAFLLAKDVRQCSV